VSNPSKNEIPSSAKQIGKQQEEREMEGAENENKITSGHFGYIEGDKFEDVVDEHGNGYQEDFENGEGRRFVTSEVVAHKGLSYKDLRKFLWS
jgi:hypothetical protein